MMEGSLTFSTCLELLEEHFSRPYLQSSHNDSAVSYEDAYFNLGAFSFDSGSRSGIFQRTEQFSEILRFLNAFMQLQFPSATWTSLCISHNVRTLLHTDAGNAPGSLNHTVSLGNFIGGQVWICPPLSAEAELVEPPPGSSSKLTQLPASTLGEQVETWHRATSFPCDSHHCTMPWQGDRWVLTAYTCRDISTFPRSQQVHLRSLGFPLLIVTEQQARPAQIPATVTPHMEFFLDLCCGASAPLSSSLAHVGIHCLQVDLLAAEGLDMLSDATYDSLLRLAFSGVVRYAHASPPCRDYSRLKLRPGGPAAIRTPEFLNGVPGNSTAQQERVMSSQKLLYRCVCILRAAFSSGAHISLEQPTNAMSWLEPFLRDMLSEVQASLVNIPACTVGQDIAKSWLFACSFPAMRQLAGTCEHRDSHPSMAGLQDSSGAFLSQRTAEYPEALAQRFRSCILPLFNQPSAPEAPPTCSLSFALACVPRKPRSMPPTAAQDGGGIYSLPDWSDGPRYQEDKLHDLRTEWQRWLLEKHLPARLQQHVAEQKENPLFTKEETAWLRDSFKRFSEKSSTASDWDFSIKSGQPYCLAALERLSTLLGDKDTSLFPALQQGVPTGFDKDIPRSHTLRPRRESEPDSGHDLLICEGNWQGAEAEPGLLQELIQEEIDSGFLEEMPSLEAAYARWGKARVAVGKVNIVKAPGRSARLVIDNSVCNTNQNCFVPEQFSLPSLQDIEAAFPPREDPEPVSAFSLDVKGAHKTTLVREQDRGLLGLRQQDRLFFYRVCPFGATFSSHWFARLGGFFVRSLHLLLWLSHILMLYVDDLLLWQNATVLPLSASLTLAFCSCFGIPLSWRKLQMGPVITWIGWELDFTAGCFTLPASKRIKLLTLLQECLHHRLVSKKALDKLLGLLQWILHGFPALRPWLSSIYEDMHRPLGTNISVSPTAWPRLADFLDDNLRFTLSPPGLGICAGSTLLSARHISLQCKADLAAVPISSKRIWVRVSDPTSSRRRLSLESRETLEFFVHLSSSEWRPRPLRGPPNATATSAADAFGKGEDCGVGGWLQFPSGRLVWFSQRYKVSNFTKLGLPMKPDANLDISSYETLAQCFTLFAFWKSQGSGRLALKLPALSDNSGAESVCNKLYTSKVPLNSFVRKLSMWSSLTGISLDCSHISGEKNDDADLLSRWDGHAPLPLHFQHAERIEISLEEFWSLHFNVSIFPADTFLLWDLPAANTLGPSPHMSKKRK